MRRVHQRIVLVIGLVGCTAVVLLAIPVLLDHFAEERLLRELDSSDEGRRHAACEALGKRGSLKAIPKLLELLAAADAAAEGSLKIILDRHPVGSCRSLAGELDHANPLVRFIAAQRLHSQGPWLRESRDQVRGALTDADPQVRTLAVYALWRMGEDPQSLVPPLSAALSERLASLGGRPYFGEFDAPLPALGDLACDALKPFLKSNNPLARQAAAVCIGRLDPVPAQAGPLLVILLDDPDEEVRRTALKGLATTRAVEQVPFKKVFQAMMTGEPQTRVAATELMGLLGVRANPQVLSYLGDLLRMDWPEVFGPAAEALAQLSVHFPEAAEELRRAAKDIDDTVSEVQVWVEAIDIVQGRAGSDGVLLEALKERVRSSTPGAAAALAWLGNKAGDVGDLWLEVEWGEQEWSVAEAIGRMIFVSQRKAAAKRSTSVTLHEHGASTHRRQIRGATAATLRSLLAGLTAEGTPQRDAAFATLRALGKHTEPLIPDLVDLLSSPTLETRLAAARLLGGCGVLARSAVPALRPLLSAREPELRVAAWEALRLILETTDVFRTAAAGGKR